MIFFLHKQVHFVDKPAIIIKERINYAGETFLTSYLQDFHLIPFSNKLKKPNTLMTPSFLDDIKPGILNVFYYPTGPKIIQF